MLLLSTLVFCAVTLALVGLYVWLVPSTTQRRLQAVAAPAATAGWTQSIVRLAGPLAQLSTPEGDWNKSPLRVKLFNAGIRQDEAGLIYYAARTLLPLVLAGAAFLVFRAEPSALALALRMILAGLAGCYLPNVVLHLLVKRRQREVFENFPDAADLLLVCVEAGMGLDAALTRVADEIRIKSLPLAEELHLTILEIRAGGTREKAMRNLALRTGIEEIGTFATMLTQADKFGTSIGDSLRVFSDDLRHKRQIRAEEHAAKVPTKMLFPLVLCIFPSIVMVILAPALIQIIRTIPKLLGGGG